MRHLLCLVLVAVFGAAVCEKKSAPVSAGQVNSIQANAGSIQTSVDFEADTGEAGCAIDARITLPNQISSLQVSNKSDAASVVITASGDGVFDAELTVPQEAGEYFVDLSAAETDIVDSNSNNVASLFVFSDGIN